MCDNVCDTWSTCSQETCSILSHAHQRHFLGRHSHKHSRDPAQWTGMECHAAESLEPGIESESEFQNLLFPSTRNDVMTIIPHLLTHPFKQWHSTNGTFFVPTRLDVQDTKAWPLHDEGEVDACGRIQCHKLHQCHHGEIHTPKVPDRKRS